MQLPDIIVLTVAPITVVPVAPVSAVVALPPITVVAGDESVVVLADQPITVVPQDPSIVAVSVPEMSIVIAPGLPGQKGEDGRDGEDGEDGAPGSGGDKYYRHVQVVADTVWDITHNLGKRASVTVIDSAGNTVEGAILYLNNDEVRAEFSAPFAGTAECN